MGAGFNPYEAPKSFEAAPPPAVEDLADLERIRYAHLNYEAGVQAAGLWHLLWTVASVAGGVVIAIGNRPSGVTLVVCGFLGAIGVVLGLVGLGLRALRPDVLIPARVVTILCMLIFPCGTLLSFPVLLLLFSPKGEYVLTPAYQQIRAVTPHIRFRAPTSVWVSVAVLVVVLLLGAILAAVAFEAH